MIRFLINEFREGDRWERLMAGLILVMFATAACCFAFLGFIAVDTMLGTPVKCEAVLVSDSFYADEDGYGFGLSGESGYGKFDVSVTPHRWKRFTPGEKVHISGRVGCMTGKLRLVSLIEGEQGE